MTKEERIRAAVTELELAHTGTKEAREVLIALQLCFLNAQVLCNVKSKDKGPGPSLEWRVSKQALYVDDTPLDQATGEQCLRAVLLHRDESIVHELERKAAFARDNRLQRKTMLDSVKYE